MPQAQSGWIMTDEPLNLDQFRQRLRDEDLVRCPRCRHLVSAVSTRCEHCGVHFEGEAHEFTARPRERERHSLVYWKRVVAVV